MLKGFGQQSGRTTTKVHFKLYKAGKFWLVGGMTTLSVLTGLATSGAVHADAATNTDENATQVQTKSDTSSDVKLAADDASDEDNQSGTSAGNTGISAQSNDPINPKGDTGDNVLGVNGSSDDSSDPDTANQQNSPIKNADSADRDSDANNGTSNGPTDSDTNSKFSDQESADKTSTDNDDSSSQYSPANDSEDSLDNADNHIPQFEAPKAVSFSGTLPVVEDDVITDTTTKPDLSTIGAPDIGTTVPGLSNMYVVTGASSATATKKTYVSYDSMAMISVTPMNTETLTLGAQFYGFYVVLPKNITASLSSFQESANTFVESLQSDPYYVNLTNIWVYQLSDTTDGREVFYFRPNDGATSGNATVDNTDRPELALYVHTGTVAEVGDNTSVQVNANTDAEVSVNDVLFAGYGNITTVKNHYIPTLATDLGITDAPDTYLAGISYKGINRFFTYTHVNVTDAYNLVDSSGTTLGSYTTSPAEDGTSYNQSTVVGDLMANLDPATYDLNSLTIDGHALDQDVTLIPANAKGSAPDVTLAGTTYTVNVDPIASAVTGKDSTIQVGSSWSPIDNLVSYTEVNGTVLSDATSLADVLKDGTLKATGTVDTTTVGDYTVTYSYTDNQGNTITSDPVTVKVIGTKITTASSTITTDSTWNPADNITAATDAAGNNLTPDEIAAAMADGHITYSIIAPDGSSVTSIDPTITGDYTIQYTYTDADNNSVSAAPITLTVKPSETNGSGGTDTGNSGSGNTNTGGNTTGNTGSNGGGQTTPTTPNKPAGSKTPSQAKPASPSKLATTVQKQPTSTAVSATTPTANTRDDHHIQALGLSSNGEGDLAAANSTKSGQQQHSSSLASSGSALASTSASGNVTDTSRSTTLPQTGEQPANLLSALGLIFLTFFGLLGFRRRQD